MSSPISPSASTLPAVTPKEGLFVLHLFYQIDYVAWSNLPASQRQQRWQRLDKRLHEWRSQPQCQAVTLAMTARADLGFMLLGPELHALQALEKEIALALGAGVLQPSFTFFSLTEQSEYTTTAEEYTAELAKQGIAPEHPEFDAKMQEFHNRIRHYTHDRMYPTLPAWEFYCFYPMLKRREGNDNWYALPFDQRKDLMKGHARVGRKYAGRVLQLITGATGLDDWEWGVSLFAHDPWEIKSIVYEMRFDPVSARYAEFGEFYTGLPLPADALWQRLRLGSFV